MCLNMHTKRVNNLGSHSDLSQRSGFYFVLISKRIATHGNEIDKRLEEATCLLDMRNSTGIYIDIFGLPMVAPFLAAGQLDQRPGKERPKTLGMRLGLLVNLDTYELTFTLR